jgi:hypothetical protein
MSLRIDHVTIAGSDLAVLENAFANVGLKTDYGGPHSNGITHMALLGFDDGSYIELISTLKPGQPAPWWDKHIVGDGGPCAWAVAVDDIATEAARIADFGIPVKGPAYFNRQRPDGVLVEWDLAFLGDQPAGATLPFLIQDRTPREWRVLPSASVTGTELTGIAMVILGVENLDRAVSLFRRVYNLPATKTEVNTDWDVRLAHFPGSPITLAAPLEENDWLSQRLARFGESPCAYLIGTSNLETAFRHLPLNKPVAWFSRQVTWLDSLRLNGVRLGIIANQTRA